MQQFMEKIRAILGNISKAKMDLIENLAIDHNSRAFEEGFYDGHEHAITDMQRPPEIVADTRFLQ